MNEILKPEYYRAIKEKTGVEPKDIAQMYPYNIGRAIVCLMRAGNKINGNQSWTDAYVEDLDKAKAHIEFEIEKALREMVEV